MMTSCFIKMSASFLWLLALIPTGANATPVVPYGADQPTNQTYPGPNGWSIKVKCDATEKTDDCNVSAYKFGKHHHLIIKNSTLPGVHWFGNIAMMSFPCGTGCRNDVFFSPPDKIDAHELIAESAINSKRRLVVSVASNPLRIFKLFNNKNPIATLHLATSFTQPEIEKIGWRNEKLEVWYRDDTGKLKYSSISIPFN